MSHRDIAHLLHIAHLRPDDEGLAVQGKVAKVELLFVAGFESQGTFGGSVDIGWVGGRLLKDTLQFNDAVPFGRVADLLQGRCSDDLVLLRLRGIDTLKILSGIPGGPFFRIF